MHLDLCFHSALAPAQFVRRPRSRRLLRPVWRSRRLGCALPEPLALDTILTCVHARRCRSGLPRRALARRFPCRVARRGLPARQRKPLAVRLRDDQADVRPQNRWSAAPRPRSRLLLAPTSDRLMATQTTGVSAPSSSACVLPVHLSSRSPLTWLLSQVIAGAIIICCLVGAEQHGSHFEKGKAAFEDGGGRDEIEERASSFLSSLIPALFGRSTERPRSSLQSRTTPSRLAPTARTSRRTAPKSSGSLSTASRRARQPTTNAASRRTPNRYQDLCRDS